MYVRFAPPGQVRNATLSDDQMGLIEAFCARIRKGLDQADFNTRRQIIELLDIRGTIAFENGDKVLYLECPIAPYEQVPLLPIVISPSSNSDWQNPVEITARLAFAAGNIKSGSASYRKNQDKSDCRRAKAAPACYG
jgi:hypothetical protein